MEAKRILGAALLAAVTASGCQSTTHTREDTSETTTAAKTDVSAIAGKWTGRGKKDGARRTLEVGTDQQGNPIFRYCYLSQCRKSTGFTLTDQTITPTTIQFRWNNGPLFTFELDGEVLRGTRGRWNVFDMQRTSD